MVGALQKKQPQADFAGQDAWDGPQPKPERAWRFARPAGFPGGRDGTGKEGPAYSWIVYSPISHRFCVSVVVSSSSPWNSKRMS